MFCTQCGKQNDVTAKFCSACGKALPLTEQDAPVASTVDSPKNVQEEIYKAVIGPNKQDYYLRHFSQFDSNGEIGVSWNWPAFFVTFYWFLYRKMWRYAFLYFIFPYFTLMIISIALMIIGLAGESSEKFVILTIAIILLTYIACVLILIPMYSNALYYLHCKKKIRYASSSSHDSLRQLVELSVRGGTSKVALIVGGVLGSYLGLGIIASISIPQYQDYVTRSKIIEGFNLAEVVKVATAETYQRLGYIPADNNLAEPNKYGLSSATNINGRYVTSVTVSAPSVNGDATITIQYNNQVGVGVPQNALLVLTAYAGPNGITWTCGYATTIVSGKTIGSPDGNGTTVPAKYLPSNCR